MPWSKQVQGSIYVITTLLIWALFAVFSRMLGSQQLNSWDLNFLRFAFATLFIGFYFCWTRRWVSFPVVPMLVLSLFGGIGYCAIVYAGFLFAPVSHSAIWLNTCIPVSTFFLSWLLISKQVSSQDLKVLFTILSAIAVMLIYGLSTGSYQFSIGDLFFFFGSIFWSAYTLLLKKFKINIRQAIVGVTVTSFVIYLPIYLLFLPKNILQESWQVIIMQGVFHGFLMVIVASISFIKSVELLGAFKAGSILALAPFLAVMLAIPMLGEWPEVASLIGLAGLLIAILKPWNWSVFSVPLSRE
ncbi:DMT family transporter [Acinetobacter thermotolerans]|uniref:DMT family transporter n=1 Tax=Acinetobacter thermotolerans TaxID=3151487 RepID=UPI00325ABF20